MRTRSGKLRAGLALCCLVGGLLHGGGAIASDAAGGLEDLLGVRARFPLEHTAVASLAAEGGAVVLLREADGGLHGLDPATGSLRWTRAGPVPAGGSEGASGPGLWHADGAFFVAGDSVVERCDPETGAVAWRFAPGGPLTVLAADDAALLVGVGEAAMAVGARDGRVLWRLREAGSGWVSAGLGVRHAALEARTGGLIFVDRGRGTVTGRWGEAGPPGRVWRVSEVGARVLVEGLPCRKRVACRAEAAAVLALDTAGREGPREALPRPEGAGAGLRRTFARILADGALLKLEDGARAWLVRRSGAEVEVEAAEGLGAPLLLKDAGETGAGGTRPAAVDAIAGRPDAAVAAWSALVFPALDGKAWRIVSPGRQTWQVRLEGVPAGAEMTGALSGGGRWALMLADDALVRLDLALSRVVGLGALDGAGTALAVSWQGGASGGWPLVVRPREVVAGRATRLMAFLGALSRAEAAGAGAEVRERRERLRRFGLTRALAGAGEDAEDAEGREAPRQGMRSGLPEEVVVAVEACAGGTCADPFALDDAEARTVATLREAWLRGDGPTVVAAAGAWLDRAPAAPEAPQRVAAALGWLLLDVAVATEAPPPTDLGWLVRRVVGLREGLPWLERVLWALVAARAGEDEAAATFLATPEATALGLSAWRAEAARGLRRLRERAGRGATAGARLQTELARYPHLVRLFGPSGERVRSLVPRLGSDPTALEAFDEYADGLGLHLVGRAAMEIELCVLGCEVLGDRCGAEHLEDACAARCTTTGAVRLAERSRASETGPGWYCGP
jgi:hypothetical protein